MSRDALRKIATQIVEGRVDPLDGARAIWELTLDDEELNPNHELDEFIYAASEWDEPRVTPLMRAQWSEVIVQRA